MVFLQFLFPSWGVGQQQLRIVLLSVAYRGVSLSKCKLHVYILHISVQLTQQYADNAHIMPHTGSQQHWRLINNFNSRLDKGGLNSEYISLRGQ